MISMGGARTVWNKACLRYMKEDSDLQVPCHISQEKPENVATVGLENTGFEVHCGRNGTFWKHGFS